MASGFCFTTDSSIRKVERTEQGVGDFVQRVKNNLSKEN